MANDFKDFSELKACVERNSGLLTVTMASPEMPKVRASWGDISLRGLLIT